AYIGCGRLTTTECRASEEEVFMATEVSCYDKLYQSKPCASFSGLFVRQKQHFFINFTIEDLAFALHLCVSH
ncbi:MAG: hypothetical protein ACK5XJ_02275, partial [Burkholderiales bacterium]